MRDGWWRIVVIGHSVIFGNLRRVDHRLPSSGAFARRDGDVDLRDAVSQFAIADPRIARCNQFRENQWVVRSDKVVVRRAMGIAHRR